MGILLRFPSGNLGGRLAGQTQRYQREIQNNIGTKPANSHAGKKYPKKQAKRFLVCKKRINHAKYEPKPANDVLIVFVIV